MGILGLPSDPHLRRWMLFVDGENFTLQAQKLMRQKDQELRPGPFFMPDVYVWMPDVRGRSMLRPRDEWLQESALRAYYYTSVQGDDKKIDLVRMHLWGLGFTPHVFKKPSGMRSKRVDITLTLDVVNHAYANNYDVAALIAGDGDYIPLVEHVKRLGKGVVVYYFAGQNLGLNPELRLAADTFVPIDVPFVRSWREKEQDQKGREPTS